MSKFTDTTPQVVLSFGAQYSLLIAIRRLDTSSDPSQMQDGAG
jgi:hypothetical protein